MHTAKWCREKAQYGDDRNEKAAELLDKLATTVENIPRRAVIRLSRTFAAYPDIGSEWSWHLRQVGFHTFPDTAEDFVQEFLDLLRVKPPPALTLV
jgi:hypothetical protein